MTYQEIQALTEEELHDKLELEQEVLRKLKFAHAVSPIENPMKIRASKKMIARIKTEMRARELAQTTTTTTTTGEETVTETTAQENA